MVMRFAVYDILLMGHINNYEYFDSVDKMISVNYEIENVHNNSNLHHNLRDIGNYSILDKIKRYLIVSSTSRSHPFYFFDKVSDSFHRCFAREAPVQFAFRLMTLTIEILIDDS